MCRLGAESCMPAALASMTDTEPCLTASSNIPEAYAHTQGCAHSREDLVGFARADNLEAAPLTRMPARPSSTHSLSAAASRFRTFRLPPVSGSRSQPRESSRWQRAGVEPLLTLPGTTLFPPQHLSAGPAGTVGRPLAQLETKASHGKFQIVARLATLWPWRTAPGTSHAANSTTGSSWPLRHARRPGEWRPNSCIATIS
jgi:hypothetical protein